MKIMDLNKNIQDEVIEGATDLFNYISKLFKTNDVNDIFTKDEINENDITKISNLFFQIEKNNILCDNTLLDLEVFEGIGNDKKNTIFKVLNKTRTKLGTYLLKKILANPITSIKELTSRQNIVKKIKENKELREKIIINLEQLKEKESNILWLWKDLNEETKYLFNMVYFQNRFLKWLNKSEIAMKLYNYYVIIFSPIYGILSPIFLILSPFVFLKFYFKTPINLSVYLKLIKIAFTGLSNIFTTDIGDLNTPTTFTITNILSIMVWITFYIYSLFSNINNAINTNKIINIIHNKLNNIAKYVRDGFNLLEITEKEIFQDDLIYKCDTNKHFNILWHGIFDIEPNIYSNKGLILKTYNIINEDKNKLMGIIKYVSNIDVFLSIYELLNEGYNFSKYMVDKRPILNVEEVFNPILKQNSVRNSIKIGLSNPLNVCITGPNAGGKSTFIKSLCLNLLLSQTLGVVSAKSIEHTIINNIHTYINIPDSKGKESLYEAEMSRALSYIKKLKTKKDGFSFVIMDEIFSSTNPEEGISGAYAIANNLSNYNTNICVLTTHYTYLSKLEIRGKFKNYKIPIERDNNNNIIYKYKLEPGVSNQLIALELLEKKGFDNEIVKDAKEICKLITMENLKKRIPKKKKQKRKIKHTKENKIKDKTDEEKIEKKENNKIKKTKNKNE